MPQAPLQQSTKIAMTSPVTAEMDAAAGEMRVSFIMPSKYTLDTLPRPGGAPGFEKGLAVDRLAEGQTEWVCATASARR